MCSGQALEGVAAGAAAAPAAVPPSTPHRQMHCHRRHALVKLPCHCYQQLLTLPASIRPPALHDHAAPGLSHPLFSTSGLKLLNISLDTLRPERFEALTRRRGHDRVLGALEDALDLGFEPLKLNVVVMRGVNDDEIPDFVELTRHRPINVREQRRAAWAAGVCVHAWRGAG